MPGQDKGAAEALDGVPLEGPSAGAHGVAEDKDDRKVDEPHDQAGEAEREKDAVADDHPQDPSDKEVPGPVPPFRGARLETLAERVTHESVKPGFHENQRIRKSGNLARRVVKGRLAGFNVRSFQLLLKKLLLIDSPKV